MQPIFFRSFFHQFLWSILFLAERHNACFFFILYTVARVLQKIKNVVKKSSALLFIRELLIQIIDNSEFIVWNMGSARGHDLAEDDCHWEGSALWISFKYFIGVAIILQAEQARLMLRPRLIQIFAHMAQSDTYAQSGFDSGWSNGASFNLCKIPHSRIFWVNIKTWPKPFLIAAFTKIV